jgi:hypothetical protein
MRVCASNLKGQYRIVTEPYRHLENHEYSGRSFSKKCVKSLGNLKQKVRLNFLYVGQCGVCVVSNQPGTGRDFPPPPFSKEP